MRKQYALLLNIIVSIIGAIFFIGNIMNNQLYTVSSLVYVLIIAVNLFNLGIWIKEKNNIKI